MGEVTAAEHGPRTSGLDESDPTVVLLHGHGSHERDLIGLAPLVTSGRPWVSLRGPVELGGDSAAWFRVNRPHGPLPGAVDEATSALWRWIDAHIPGRSIIPIGFSQGGAMALQLLQTRPDRVAAAAVLSGFLHEMPVEPIGPNRVRPSVFWGRGDADPLVDPMRVKITEKWLQTHAAAESHVYPGLGHGIAPDETGDLSKFLRHVLPDERGNRI
jgi:phospholipase/carboxylesterase